MPSLRISITKHPEYLKGTVTLPASKSLSNRALLIRAVSGLPFPIQNLSDADDTVLMESIFQNTAHDLYIKNAGTAARFLLAYFASRPCDVVLSGSPRMHERPVAPLINALQQLGADITFRDRENHLPVHIKGRYLNGGQVSVAANISSQFISALLMIGPGMREGLVIKLEKEVVSEPYIAMTLQMMDYFGVQVARRYDSLVVPPQAYRPVPYFVESDWSAASYFFALAAVYPAELHFPHLTKDSWQGDSVLMELIKSFGVRVSFEKDLCSITSGGTVTSFFEYDFKDCPDLVPTFVCLCATMHIPFKITGTSTLKYKETDRGEALKTELEKIGIHLIKQDNSLEWDGKRLPHDENSIVLNTYDDHRMAMSFTLLTARKPHIIIENPDVVDKSFPRFWEEMEKLGFELERG